MTETQLYLTIGMPTFAVLVGILVNSVAINTINSRLTSLAGRVGALESKVDTKFDLLLGKIFELDNRLSRLEERLKN
jgi:hypothetical protein